MKSIKNIPLINTFDLHRILKRQREQIMSALKCGSNHIIQLSNTAKTSTNQHIIDLTARLNGSIQAKAIIESELEECRCQVLSFAKDLYDTKLELSKLQDEFEYQIEKYKSLEASLRESERNCTDYKNETAGLQRQLEELETSYHNMTKIYEKTAAELSKFKVTYECSIAKTNELSFLVLEMTNFERVYKEKVEVLENEMKRLLKHNEVLQLRYESKVQHGRPVQPENILLSNSNKSNDEKQSDQLSNALKQIISDLKILSETVY